MSLMKNSQKSGPSSSREKVTETSSAPGLETATRSEVAYPIGRSIPVSSNKITFLITTSIIFMMIITICLISVSSEEKRVGGPLSESVLEGNSEVVIELKNDIDKSSKKADIFVEDIEELQRHLEVQQMKREYKNFYEETRERIIRRSRIGSP